MGSESPSSLELDRKRLCDRVAPVTDLEEEREEERDVRFMLSWVIQGADDASCSGLRGSYLGGVNDIEMTSRGSLFVSICSTEKNVSVVRLYRYTGLMSAIGDQRKNRGPRARDRR